MKAIVQTGYGSSEYLQLTDVETPTPSEDQVLIMVVASCVNAGDLFSLKGSPWMIRLTLGLPKPKGYIPGWDAAGIVKSVGGQVTRFRPGDEVYCSTEHCFAEYVVADESAVAKKPKNLTFEEAAVVPTAGLTALQALRDHGTLQSGQDVLVNGASGGVGTFAVQIAKALGAGVTGVCSTRNVEMVRTLGADRVVDYTKEDFVTGTERYDLVLDNVASRKLSDLRRVLKPNGTIQPNSGHGGMSYVVRSFLLSIVNGHHGKLFMAHINAEDLNFLAGLIENESIRPVVDKTYSLAEVPTALDDMDREHPRGKIAIHIES